MSFRKSLFFCLIAILPSLSLAADIPPDAQMQDVEDFSGGLGTTFDPHDLQPNESPNMYNLLVDESPGNLVQINGYTLAGSTNVLTKVNGIYLYYKTDGTKEYLVTDSSIVLATSDFSSWKTVRTGLNNSGKCRCTQVIGNMWCTNGINSVFEWNGTSSTALDGTQNTPNVPKGAIIAFYQERVFMYNRDTDSSELDFSAQTDTAGFSLNPDNANAWPSSHYLKIGQGDGQLGTAFIKFKGQAYLGKDRSIYYLSGIDQTDYRAQIVNSRMGPLSQESWTFSDDIVKFFGYDGIYAFDGSQSARISDAIIPDILAVNKTLSANGAARWSTAQDLTGGQFSGSTIASSGYIQLNSSINVVTMSTTSPPVAGAYWYVLGEIGAPSTFTAFNVIQPTVSLNSNTAWVFPSTLRWWMATSVTSFFGHDIANLILSNLRTGQTLKTSYELFGVPLGYSGPLVAFQVTMVASTTWRDYNDPRGLVFTGDDINSGNLSVKWELDTPYYFNVASNSFTGNNGGVVSMNLSLNPSATAQYISMIGTVPTSAANWGTFSVDNFTNGGNINYFIRSATSVVNVATETWKPIIPGAQFTAPVAKRFVQWATTMTAVQYNVSPAIQDASLQYLTGGSADSLPLMAEWKRRPWVCVSTDASTSSSLIYIGARKTAKNPIAWVLARGINLKSMIPDKDSIFYGGSSSSGSIYRLDYGTNFNGTAIQSYYESPEFSLGQNRFVEKDIQEYLLDMDREPGGNFTLGTSRDGAVTWLDSSYSMNGTGRLLRSVYGVPTKSGKFFRFRFIHSDLDVPFKLNSFAILYQQKQAR